MSDGKTSMEEAGGCAVGLTGTINGWNADSEARMCNALMNLGKWVNAEAGCLLGHIKAAIVLEDGTGMTLNLTDLDNGVEHHGVLDPQETVKFSFMAAVLDVDEHELKHNMFHAIDDQGLDYVLDEHEECHCHDHHHHHDDGSECHCHDHEHEHEHHHDHGEFHEHHHHDDGSECHCHDHEHEHEHFHEHENEHYHEECEEHVHHHHGNEYHVYYHYIHEYHYYYHDDDEDDHHHCHCHEE